MIVQEVQRFCRNAEVLRCRGSSRGDCAGAGAEQVQRCRGFEEVQVQVRRCGGAEQVQSAEVQRCRCVDVQAWRCRGAVVLNESMLRFSRGDCAGAEVQRHRGAE